MIILIIINTLAAWFLIRLGRSLSENFPNNPFTKLPIKIAILFPPVALGTALFLIVFGLLLEFIDSM